MKATLTGSQSSRGSWTQATAVVGALRGTWVIPEMVVREGRFLENNQALGEGRGVGLAKGDPV